MTNTLPSYMKSKNYHSAFLTTGNLSFMGKGAWLDGLGFDEVEGHEHPFYNGMPRMHFDAANDDALYARAKQWMEQSAQASKRPFFLVLETVSTHQPYQHPITGERTLQSVVKYADQALSSFVQNLENSGYFDSGYLFITGDHRAMVPLSSQELKLFGDRAYARVPMWVKGPGLITKQMAQASFSQTDFFPTMRYLTDQDPICLNKHQGIFWPKSSVAPECLLTRRPYDLDTVVVQCGGTDHPIKLDGNETAYTQKPHGPPEWLDQIHGFRTRKAWLHESPVNR
jgi:phosphoglycerol transferase MdoB-like AlkP superfamily enzyme